MDYLDPVKKRKHAIRLYIGYALFAVTIAIATVILVYLGTGYFVDRKTGELIQNGQLFVNSDPDGATIYLNGHQERPKTAGRLVVPSGNYNVTLKRDGFRDWTATILLEGGRVQKLDYARLLPSVLAPAPVQTFATSPYAITESADRRYVSLQFTDKPLSIYMIDLTKPDSPPKEVIIPDDLLTNTKGQLVISEWSDDNKHFLVKNVVDGTPIEYLMVNRETPAKTVNVSKQLGLSAVELSLRDLAYDQYYVYDAALKTLGTVALDSKPLVPKLTGVVAYKTYDSDNILYVTADGASVKTKMQVRLSTGDKTYLMREVTQSPTYLLDMSKVGSSQVIAIGVPSENKITILRNPISYLHANPKQTLPLPITVLQVTAPTEVSFSTDGSVVMARGAQNFAAHNFEEDHTVRYELNKPITAYPLQWIDGKHLVAVSAGYSYMFDYDGANVQQLLPSIEGLGVLFDNSYQSVYGFTAGADGKPFNVNRASLLVN